MAPRPGLDFQAKTIVKSRYKIYHGFFQILRTRKSWVKSVVRFILCVSFQLGICPIYHSIPAQMTWLRIPSAANQLRSFYHRTLGVNWQNLRGKVKHATFLSQTISCEISDNQAWHGSGNDREEKKIICLYSLHIFQWGTNNFICVEWTPWRTTALEYLPYYCKCNTALKQFFCSDPIIICLYKSPLTSCIALQS